MRISLCLFVWTELLMQQNIVEACDVAVEAVEEQKGSSIEADEEGIGSIARVWAGSDCQN